MRKRKGVINTVQEHIIKKNREKEGEKQFGDV